MHRAFLHLGCALICWNFVARLRLRDGQIVEALGYVKGA
jgi:hypothetical protein